FRDQGTEQFLARAEGNAAQILAVEIEQVERDQRESAAMPFAERLLQVAEIGAALGIEHRDLAVEPELLAGQRTDFVGKRGEFIGPVLARARHERDLVAIAPAIDAVTIDLDLV